MGNAGPIPAGDAQLRVSENEKGQGGTFPQQARRKVCLLPSCASFVQCGEHRSPPPGPPPLAPRELRPGLPSDDRADKRRGENRGRLVCSGSGLRGAVRQRAAVGPEQCRALSRGNPVHQHHPAAADPGDTGQLVGQRVPRPETPAPPLGASGCGVPAPGLGGGAPEQLPRKLMGWEPRFVIWNELLRATKPRPARPPPSAPQTRVKMSTRHTELSGRMNENTDFLTRSLLNL